METTKPCLISEVPDKPELTFTCSKDSCGLSLENARLLFLYLRSVDAWMVEANHLCGEKQP